MWLGPPGAGFAWAQLDLGTPYHVARIEIFNWNSPSPGAMQQVANSSGRHKILKNQQLTPI